MKRCEWVPEGNALYTHYHDTEWGVPVFDDAKLFEFLILEGFQAGLSWITILRKRENFRRAFDNFDAVKISYYDNNKTEELMQNPGIIRNRSKIESAVTNARLFLKIQETVGSFAKFIWQYTGGKPIVNHWKSLREVPATSEISDKMAGDLKKMGFKYRGSTICYAFMQAVGMVNDHTVDCFRHSEIVENFSK